MHVPQQNKRIMMIVIFESQPEGGARIFPHPVVTQPAVLFRLLLHILGSDTVGGRNPAPPGMVKTC